MRTNPFFPWLALVGVCCGSRAVFAQAQLQPLWGLDPGSRPYLTTDYNQRGMAYNPATGHLLLANRAGGLSVQTLDGTTGADLGSLKTTGISGGTFSLNQVAVADDGAIYGANLVAPSSGASPFKIYRWANESATPTLVYSGEPVAGTRWGDTIDIRGSGNSTQILLSEGGAGVGNHIAVFTTADNGVTFAPKVMTLSGQGFALGDSRGGVAFGSGDGFLTKNAGGTSLYLGTFNLDSSSAALTAVAALPNSLSGFSVLGTGGIDASLLAAININTASVQTAPQNVYLFDLSHPATPVVLDIESFINPGFQNLRASGAVDFGGGKLFALDSNNGLRAYDIIPEPQTYVLFGLGLGACWWRWRQTSRRDG